jgi:exonuclease SbcC
MYLTSIQLENFRRFAFAQVDFPDGVVGIIGNNGAGKSTLIEALAWALYGNDASRTDKEQIKRLGARAQDICRVILDFQMNGDNFRVVREMRGRSDMPDASIIVNKEVVVRGSSQAIDFIKKSLDMDFKAFMTSFYARQKELNALSDFAPYQRKEVLLRMLGIEDVDLALKTLRSDKRDLDTKLEVFRAQKEDMNILKQEKERVEESLKALKDGLKDKEADLEKSQKLLQQEEEAFNQQKEKFTLFTRLSNEIDVKNTEKRGLEEQINFQKREKERLLSLQEELEKMELEIVDYDKIKETYFEYEKRKEKYNFYLDTKKHFENLQRLIEEDEQSKRELELRIKERERLEEELSDAQKKLEHLKQDLDKDRKLYAKLDAEYTSACKECEKLKEQLENIEKLGADSICDRCLRPLGKDYPKIKLHLSRELEEIDGKIRDLEKRRDGVEIEGKGLKDKERKSDELKNSLEKDIRTLLGDRKDLEDVDKRLKEKIKSASDFSQSLSNLGKIDYDQEEHQKIKSKWIEVEEKKRKADLYQEEAKKISRVENIISQLSGKIKEVDNQLAEIKKKIDELSYLTEEYTQSEKNLEKARQEVSQKQMALKEAQHKVELVYKDLEAIDDKIKGSQRIADEIKVWTVDRTYLEKLETVLGDFKLSLIGRIRPTLSFYASQLLSELTEGKYQDMELDGNYEIYITENGEKFPLERFSGGEKDLANLCLRLAISFMISESSGVGFSFIILDEIFGSQDALRKENIINLLAKLKSRFRQIFLITHIDDIKDSVENLLYVVESENGTSQVIMQ